MVIRMTRSVENVLDSAMFSFLFVNLVCNVYV